MKHIIDFFNQHINIEQQGACVDWKQVATRMAASVGQAANAVNGSEKPEGQSDQADHPSDQDNQ